MPHLYLICAASAFSERYLGTPQWDDSRYQFSSVLQNAQAFREQTLMLVHGTTDANVHFQHTAELVKNLVKIYPDEGHFLSRQSRQHLSSTLTSFYRECLQEQLLPLSDEEEPKQELTPRPPRDPPHPPARPPPPLTTTSSSSSQNPLH
ncbi:hypothetical protein CRUP_031655 [Coryphaenoides rupestris]|nr:hypothetical protein CRUP_031655 [Coryphaenoides rupestris]